MRIIKITLFLFILLLCVINASAVNIDQVDIYVQENGDASVLIRSSLSGVWEPFRNFWAAYKSDYYNEKVMEKFSTRDGSSINIAVDMSRTNLENDIVWLKWSDFANVEQGKFSTPRITLADGEKIERAYVIFPDRGYYGFTNGQIDRVHHAIDPKNLIPLQKSYGNSLDVNFWNEKGNEHLQSFELSQYGFDPTKMAIDVAAEVAGAGYYGATATAFKSAVAISYAISDWFSAYDIASIDSNSGITSTNYAEIQTLIEGGEYVKALDQIELAKSNLAKSKENYETRKQEMRDKAFSKTTTKEGKTRPIEAQTFLIEKGDTHEFNIPLNPRDSYIKLFLNNDLELDDKGADGKYKISLSLRSWDGKYSMDKYETTVDKLNTAFSYSLYHSTNTQYSSTLKGLNHYSGYGSALKYGGSESPDDLSLNVAITIEQPYESKEVSNSDKYLSLSSAFVGIYGEETVLKDAKTIEKDKNQFLKDSKKLDASIENINIIIGLLEGDKKLINKWIDEGIIQNSVV